MIEGIGPMPAGLNGLSGLSGLSGWSMAASVV
jgi:hypothetical protein